MYDKYEKHLAAQLYPEVINFCYIITTISKDNKLDQELAMSKGIELINSLSKNTVAHESNNRNYMAELVTQSVEPKVTQSVEPEVTQSVEPTVTQSVEPEPVVELVQPKVPDGFEQSVNGIAEVFKQKLTLLAYKKIITEETKSEILDKVYKFASENIKSDKPFMKPIELVYNNLKQLKAEFVDHSKLYEAETEEEIRELSAVYLANHSKLHKGTYPLKVFMAANMNNKASKWYFSLLSPLFIELRDMFTQGIDWEWVPDKECFKVLNDCSFSRPYWITSIYKWIAKDFFAFNELEEITGIVGNPKFRKSRYRIHNIDNISKQAEVNTFVIDEVEQFNLLAPLFDLEPLVIE